MPVTTKKWLAGTHGRATLSGKKNPYKAVLKATGDAEHYTFSTDHIGTGKDGSQLYLVEARQKGREAYDFVLLQFNPDKSVTRIGFNCDRSVAAALRNTPGFRFEEAPEISSMTCKFSNYAALRKVAQSGRFRNQEGQLRYYPQ
ncbi:hypothetical protein [Pseudogemmobacter bohemicus]|uniref:hypothetical protein n=1 Tax=Pseudogemmobacter bohemicus TaxID=2250708 RepID=UPI00130034FF|nr:hypothetical protein [Pseudogemmobacter bohemicus]